MCHGLSFFFVFVGKPAGSVNHPTVDTEYTWFTEVVQAGRSLAEAEKGERERGGKRERERERDQSVP